MRNTLLTVGALAVASLGFIAPASAHDAGEVRHLLRDRGYYNIQFLVDEAPFQVDACYDGERYHLHVDYYGNVTERASVGHCDQGRYSRRERGYREE